MVCSLWGAKAQIGHLMSYDKRHLHFGIQVGLTQSKFDVDYTWNDSIRAAMQGVASYNAAGFHISVIGDYTINRFLNLRILPGVTLLNRDVKYSWASDYAATHPLVEDGRTVESVYGEFPVELKFRALRWKNFRPYITAGVDYGFDFASLRKNKNNNNESIIRLNPNDLRYSAGIGIDVFLRYVKFAVEMKLVQGFIDLSVPDNDLYTLAVDRITSRTVLLSFTFEG